MQADTLDTTSTAGESWYGSVLNYELYHYGDFRFTVLNVVLIGIVILAMIVLAKVTSRLLTKYFAKIRWVDEQHQRSLIRLSRTTIVIVGFAVFIESLVINMNIKIFKTILEFTLFTVKDYTFSVYNIFVVVLIFFLAKLIISFTTLFLKHRFRKKETLDEGKQYTIITMFSYIFWTCTVLLALDSLGFHVTAILIACSSLLVGVALGLQQFFTDIVSGFVLLFEGTIKVGDIVETDNLVCRVTQINIRTSKVLTRDGNVIIIPNRKLTSENISNWSYADVKTRFKVEVGVGYGSDTALVRELLLEAAKEQRHVDNNKGVTVRFEEFGDSALNFELLFWTSNRWSIDDVKSDLRFAIDKKFRDNDISIPFPQRDLHIVSDFRTEQDSGVSSEDL